MPRFVFRMQALLDIRSQEERERQLAVARLERERLDLEGRLTACQREIASHKADLRALLGGPDAAAGVDTRTVRLQAGASLHAEARAQRLAIQLAGLYKRLEAARSALREATTRRRAVDLLRERRREEWAAGERRAEARELDDLSTMRFARDDQSGVNARPLDAGAGPPRSRDD